jgi:hypothetical protein
MLGGVMLLYNQRITGSLTTDPLNAYYDQYFGPGKYSLGFGPKKGLGWALDAFPGHTPLEALLNTSLNLFSVNIELFGWSTGSLVLVALLLFAGRLQRNDYVMLAVLAAVVGAYSLYWYSGGPDFGARYWYLTLIPLIALAIRGVEFLEWKLRFASATPVLVGVLALGVMSLINYLPWRAIDKYHHYLRMRPDIPRLAQTYGFGKSLVLVRGDSHPDYASAWIYNPLDLHADVPLYAWDRDEDTRTRLLKAFPDRRVWIVEGPSITQGSFRVVAGPLSANELLTMGNVSR